MLHYMKRKTDKFLKTLSPLSYEVILTVFIARYVIKLNEKESRIKGGNDVFFKQNFLFSVDVMQNSAASTQILAKIYRPRLKDFFLILHFTATQTNSIW